MGYPIVCGNGVYALTFFMRDSTTGQGKTGLSPTVVIRRTPVGGVDGNFGTPAGAVTEIGNGFYQVAGNVADTGALGANGPLCLYATASGADAAAEIYPVVYHNPWSLFQSTANVAAFGGGFEADAYNQVFHYLHAAARAGTLLYDGPAISGTSNTVTLDPVYRSAATDAYKDAQAVAYISDSVTAGGTISAYNGSTGVCTLSSGNMSAVSGSTWVEIYANKASLRAPLLDPAGRVTLAGAGLDAITVESGINARQALAGTLAVAGGSVSGAASSGSSTITITGANVVTTRFQGDCDGLGNRTVTFTPPA